ncbi:hypothetical protein [Eikenella halliae]|uniref:hypothetical protein n=1 Tax=Eikenella halliae TaxID=1795832 RepID=UPI0012E709F5|nr:hypothetical protein [Eikenella halliae]
MNKTAKDWLALPYSLCCLRLAALLRFCSSTKRIFKRFGFNPPWARGLDNPTAAAPAWFGYACGRPNRCNIKYRIREPGLRISGSLQLGWHHGRSPFGVAWILESDISCKGYLKTEFHRLPTHFTRKKAETAPYGFSLLLFR